MDVIEFADELENFINDADIENIRAPRIYMRDLQNPMERYNEKQFRERFRFSKDVVENVLLPMLDIEHRDKRGLPISPMLQLLIALRFYATASFQLVCADLEGISQPTVSRVVKKVSRDLAMRLPRTVKFPNDLKAVQRKFRDIAGFPGVIGCIDCTHIPIKSPGGDNGEVFRNRKGWMSLNVQVVGGPGYEIYDVVSRWPGSAHDSRIFENSSVKVRIEDGRLKGLLLGDAGYMQTNYMYTPFPDPQTRAERLYNRSQTTTRTTIERLFGIWKRRFPCLSRKMQNKLNNILVIIPACAVLHNLGRRYNPEEFNVEDGDENDDEDTDEVVENIATQNLRGRVIRNTFVARHFTH